MIKTITIQIGNSDNKLTQQEWSNFILDINNLIYLSIITTSNPFSHRQPVYFTGGSEQSKPWQNYCWVFNTDQHVLNKIIPSLEEIKKTYRQDSIALTIGETRFI